MVPAHHPQEHDDILVEKLLGTLEVGDAPGEGHVATRLAAELDARGVLGDAALGQETRTPPYRLVHSEEIVRARLDEDTGGGHLELLVAAGDDLIFLAPRLSSASSGKWRARPYPSISRGQWYGRADAALQRAVLISGHDIDGTEVTLQRGKAHALPGLALKEFGAKPAETLWNIGFTVEPPRPGAVLVAIDHLFIADEGAPDESWLLPYRGAAVGPLLAHWDDSGADRPVSDGRLADAASSERAPVDADPEPAVLVVLSVDDPQSQELAGQLKRAGTTRGVQVIVRFALHRYAGGHVTADHLTTLLSDAVRDTPRISCVVVHHGAAFGGNIESYRRALGAFRQAHPNVGLATEALPPGTGGEVDGVRFDQPHGCEFVLEMLSF